MRYQRPDWFTKHVFNPLVAGLTRMGLSLAFSRPWSHSTRLFSYWPALCKAAGSSPSPTLANAGAQSVMTSPGSP